MKHKFKNLDEVMVLQSFIEENLMKLQRQDSTKPERLLAAILKELYGNKIMPLLIKQESNSPKIKLTESQTIALDILLSNYDLTEIQNIHAGATLMSLANDIDYFLVNNTKTYKQCSPPLLLNTGESSLSIKN
jgi:hypothetical protein